MRLNDILEEAKHRMIRYVRPMLKANPHSPGYYVIGYGHVISGTEKSLKIGNVGDHISSFRITKEEAESLLMEDLERHFKTLRLQKKLPEEDGARIEAVVKMALRYVPTLMKRKVV